MIRIGAAQVPQKNSIEKNLAKALAYKEKAAEKGSNSSASRRRTSPTTG